MASSRYDAAEPAVAAADSSGCLFTPGARALLLQDVVPWTSAPNQDPLGADVTELKAQGKRFDLCSSDLIGAIALNKYDEILIASAQTQRFYDNLFPGGVIHFALVNWTERGGILTAQLADNASGPGAGGNWNGRIFAGGVRKVVRFANANGIVAAQSPIITGEFGGPNGCGIVDVAPLMDLDGWSFSSHGFFTDLPPGTRIILAEDPVGVNDLTRPVLIEYRFGRGRVIASMTTTEFRYAGGFGVTLPQNRKLLANEIGYQNHLAECRHPDRPAAAGV